MVWIPPEGYRDGVREGRLSALREVRNAAFVRREVVAQNGYDARDMAWMVSHIDAMIKCEEGK